MMAWFRKWWWYYWPRWFPISLNNLCTNQRPLWLILFVTKFDLVENFHWVNYSIHYTFYFIFVLLFVLDQTKTISYFYMFFLVNLNPCFAGPRVYLKISIFVILSYTRSFSNKTSPCWRCMEIQTNNMFAHIQPS